MRIRLLMLGWAFVAALACSGPSGRQARRSVVRGRLNYQPPRGPAPTSGNARVQVVGVLEQRQGVARIAGHRPRRRSAGELAGVLPEDTRPLRGIGEPAPRPRRLRLAGERLAAKLGERVRGWAARPGVRWSARAPARSAASRARGHPAGARPRPPPAPAAAARRGRCRWRGTPRRRSASAQACAAAAARAREPRLRAARCTRRSTPERRAGVARDPPRGAPP